MREGIHITQSFAQWGGDGEWEGGAGRGSDLGGGGGEL
jgi:hypothetical protein